MRRESWKRLGRIVGELGIRNWKRAEVGRDEWSHKWKGAKS